MVTTPNYSLSIDQPRWDDLHSLKRIAIVHEEFLNEGLPAALHVNARTDKDWERDGGISFPRAPRQRTLLSSSLLALVGPSAQRGTWRNLCRWRRLLADLYISSCAVVANFFLP